MEKLRQPARETEFTGAALECADDLLWVRDLSTGSITWDSKAATKLGLPASEVPRTFEEWQKWVHPDDRERFLHWVEHSRKTGEGYEVEYRVRHHGGNWQRWLERGRVLPGEPGEAVRMAGACVDVTFRRQAEEHLRLNEAKLWDVLEHTNDCVWEISTDGNFTFTNPRASELLGFPEQSVVGRNLFTFLPRREARRVYRSFSPFLRHPIPFTAFEHEVVTISGKRKIFETSGTPIIDRNGQFHGFRGLSRDITERKQQELELRRNEKLYRNLVENASDAIFALAPDGAIRALNPAFENLTGWPVDKWIGEKFHGLVHPEDQAIANGCLHEALQGESIPSLKLRIRTASDHWLTGEFSISPRDEDGRTVELLGVGRDITDRKDIETRWARLRKVEMIGEFAGGVAHKFNNHLTAIKGFAELLREEVSSTEGKKRLAELLEASERAVALNHRLLEFKYRDSTRTAALDFDTAVGEMKTLLAGLRDPGDSSASATAPDDPLHTGKETVLLVEDEPAVRRLARLILERLGHPIIEADNAMDALEKAASAMGAIDLLLTDMIMPKMSGSDLAEKLRESNPDLKVILMSGYNINAYGSTSAAPPPGIRFLPKPFSASTLSRHVREVLDE